MPESEQAANHTPNAPAGPLLRDARAERHGLLWGFGLCVSVWFVSCLFFRGDLGWWNDDYWLCRRAVPGSEPLPMFLRQYTPFEPAEPGLSWWRPLFLIVGPLATTTLWDTPWVLHAIDAVLHLAVCGLFFVLLREVRLSRRAALVGTLMLIVCAPASELIFWAACTSSAIAAVCLLACLVCSARGVRTGQWAWLVAAVVCGLPVPLLNEQPAAVFLVLPSLALAARGDSMDVRRALARIAPVVGALGLWCIAYLVAIMTHPAGPDRVGAAGTLINPANTWPVTLKAVRWTWKVVFEWHFLRDASIGEGLRAMTQRPAWAATLGVCALLCAVATAVWMARTERECCGTTGAERRRPRWGWLVIAGLAVLTGSLLPLIAVSAPIRPRMVYLPWLSVCILAAVGVEYVRSALSARGKSLRLWSWCAMVPFAWLIGASAIAMIGVQSAYHARAELDRGLARQLREAMPNPPSGTVFFVLRVDDWPTQTHNPHFDHFLIGPLGPAWSFTTFVQHAYQRPDVHIATMHWELPRFAWADATTVVPTIEMPDGFPRDPLPESIVARAQTEELFKRIQAPIRWERIVPLEVMPDGTIVAIQRLVVTQPDGTTMRVDLPRTSLWKGEVIAERWFDAAPLRPR